MDNDKYSVSEGGRGERADIEDIVKEIGEEKLTVFPDRQLVKTLNIAYGDERSSSDGRRGRCVDR